MSKTNESLDLYTRWKRDEAMKKLYESPEYTPIHAIPLRTDTSKVLVPSYSQVFYTDGFTSLKEDFQYERTLFDEEMEVPSIGTDRKNFEIAEIITFDILGASTLLPLMCKMIVHKQGATKEREPPILVRDVCLQWDGFDVRQNQTIDSIIDRVKQETLQRTQSSDIFSDHQSISERHRCLSMNSSLTEDDDLSSIITTGGTIRHRVSRLIQREKNARLNESNWIGRSEYYSAPFYQYRSRRDDQKSVAVQTNSTSRDNQQYSVTIVLPILTRSQTSLGSSRIGNNFRVSLFVPHSTVVHLQTKQFVTIRRTFQGKQIDA